MKKALVPVLCLSALVTSVSDVQAKPWSPPLSFTNVFLTASTVTAGTWAGLKYAFKSPFNSFKSKKSLLISAAAVGTGLITLGVLSLYTQSGYFVKAKKLIDGDGSANKDLLNFIKYFEVGSHTNDAERLAEHVIDYFAANENELAASVSVLKQLHDEMVAAVSYLDIARSVPCDYACCIENYRSIAVHVISMIKAVSMIIKSHKDYQRQYENRMTEQKIAAQNAMANALHRRADAASFRVNYNM